MTNVFTRLVTAGIAALSPLATVAYPLDAYEETGIARLEFYRLAQTGEIRGRQLPSGALLRSSQITLATPKANVDANGQLELPVADDALSKKLKYTLSSADRGRYGIALLDYSDPENPIYAEHRDDYFLNVGSVGKVIAGAGLMQQLADVYPDDIVARKHVLKNTRVTADSYSVYDHHKVPIFDVENRKLQHRALRIGDSGSLWEYLDWMFSASSNAAASMVIQQGTLLSHFQRRYPATQSEHDTWLQTTPAKDEGAVMVDMLSRGLEANGFNTERLRQGSYFTRTGKQKASGVRSYGQPRELVRLLYAIETGKLVDEWSSLELKRLLYMTQKRIRYSSHPALKDAAVYFKSGSLYSCREEEGFVCGKYKGNRINILASIAIVEYPAENPHLRYAVAVLSNVLRKNSAVAHQTLALRIHRLLEKIHPAPIATPKPEAVEIDQTSDSSNDD